MDDFTAANIAVDEKKREEELEGKKVGKVDYSVLEKEIDDAKEHAKEVGRLDHLVCQEPSLFLAELSNFPYFR
jgi:hypothetical protein